MCVYAAILHVLPPSAPITDSLTPTVLPAYDTLVAIGSPDNVTYNCRANADDTFWELNGRQIQGEVTKAMYRNAHIFIEDQSGGNVSSTLTVTLEGREVLGRDPVPVLCYALSEAEFYASPGKTFYIIQFGEVFCCRLQCFGIMSIGRCSTFLCAHHVLCIAHSIPVPCFLHV